MSDSLRDVIYDAMGRPGDWEQGVIQPSQFELDNHSHWRAIAGDVARAITEAGWRPPLPAATAEHDTEADAWYIRVLDEPVHHTTEHAPANLDWTRDGRLIGIELLGPLRRDRVDQQDLMRHAYLHVEAQKRIKSMALRVSAGAPIGWRDWIREAVWALADGGYLTEPTESTVDRARAEREAKHDG